MRSCPQYQIPFPVAEGKPRNLPPCYLTSAFKSSPCTRIPYFLYNTPKAHALQKAACNRFFQLRDAWARFPRQAQEGALSSVQGITLNHHNYPKVQGAALWDSKVSVTEANIAWTTAWWGRHGGTQH